MSTNPYRDFASWGGIPPEPEPKKRSKLYRVTMPVIYVCCVFSIIMATLMLMFAIIFLPAIYLDGKARAAYLKKTEGIELPWYQAAFIPVRTQTINAHIETKP